MSNSSLRFALASAAMIASLILARRAAAQEDQRPPNVAQPSAASDSLPFRRGQWGAEFAINDGTFGLGILRFRSPRTAWLLDASAGASWSDSESSLGDRSGSTVSVRVRTGPRRYRPIGTDAAAHVGMGVTGSYRWARSSDDRLNSWDAGVFGEIGAAYFVTSHLSLGAQVEISAEFEWFHQRYSDSGFGSRDRRVGLVVRPVRIVGALYF